MEDKTLYIVNGDKQNYHFCRSNLQIERGFDTASSKLINISTQS